MRQLVILLAALLLIGSCGQSEETKRRLSREERARLAREDSAALKIAVMPTLDCLPLYVAKEEAIFDSLGADIRLKAYTALMDCDTAIVRHRVEGLMTETVSAAWLEDAGTPLTILGRTALAWQLLSGSTTRLARTEQMDDKMMAITRHSATDMLGEIVIDSAKLVPERVFRIQVNDVDVRLRMMLVHAMDAAWMAEPQATAARLAHAGQMKHCRLDEAAGILALRTDIAADPTRKKQIDILCRAYNIAADRINRRGLAAYRDIIAKRCHVHEEVADSLPKINFRHLTAPDSTYINKARAWVRRTKENLRHDRQ